MGSVGIEIWSSFVYLSRYLFSFCGLSCLVSIWNSMLLLTVHSFYSYSRDYVVPQGWIDSLFVHFGMGGFPSSLGILSFKY